jgi:hypothetical protein
MNRYSVLFITTTDVIERTYEAASGDECLNQARADFASSGEDQDELDEIVVRPGNGKAFLGGVGVVGSSAQQAPICRAAR